MLTSWILGTGPYEGTGMDYGLGFRILRFPVGSWDKGLGVRNLIRWPPWFLGLGVCSGICFGGLLGSWGPPCVFVCVCVCHGLGVWVKVGV